MIWHCILKANRPNINGDTFTLESLEKIARKSGGKYRVVGENLMAQLTMDEYGAIMEPDNDKINVSCIYSNLNKGENQVSTATATSNRIYEQVLSQAEFVSVGDIATFSYDSDNEDSPLYRVGEVLEANYDNLLVYDFHKDQIRRFKHNKMSDVYRLVPAKTTQNPPTPPTNLSNDDGLLATLSKKFTRLGKTLGIFSKYKGAKLTRQDNFLLVEGVSADQIEFDDDLTLLLNAGWRRKDGKWCMSIRD